MEAIRETGGASGGGLKPNKKIEMELNKIGDDNKEADSDLMSQLKSTLSRRRKGTSGESEAQAKGMNRIRKIIPPPTGEDLDDSETEEEDWE